METHKGKADVSSAEAVFLGALAPGVNVRIILNISFFSKSYITDIFVFFHLILI